MLVWGGVAVSLVAAIGLGFWVTEQPVFCGRVCHEMAPQYDGWLASPHPDVRCLACHAEPGPIGFLEAHVVDGARDVWVHFTQRPERITGGAHVPPPRCLECHADQFDAAQRGDGDEEEHPLPENHPDRDSECPDCHYDEIHEPE